MSNIRPTVRTLIRLSRTYWLGGSSCGLEACSRLRSLCLMPAVGSYRRVPACAFCSLNAEMEFLGMPGAQRMAGRWQVAAAHCRQRMSMRRLGWSTPRW